MLNSRYAMYFNKRHELDGHVFQGRYGSELIDSPQYFLEVSRYIHLNPVKAELVKHPGEYPWSSYSSYVSENKNPLVSTERIISYFTDKEMYRSYVMGPDPEPAASPR